MNSPINDDDLTALYLQRKKQVTPPVIDVANLMATKQKPTKLVQKLGSIIGLTFIASFSIFALIVQLKEPPKVQSDNKKIVIHREIDLLIDKNIVNNSLEPVINENEIPELPKVLNKEKIINIPIVKNEVTIETPLKFSVVKIDKNTVYPKFYNDNSPLVIINKVLPQYPNKAMESKIEGKVKLSYQVSSSGVVFNIEVLTSTPKSLFNKAAINALRQWQYEKTP